MYLTQGAIFTEARRRLVCHLLNLLAIRNFLWLCNHLISRTQLLVDSVAPMVLMILYGTCVHSYPIQLTWCGHA